MFFILDSRTKLESQPRRWESSATAQTRENLIRKGMAIVKVASQCVIAAGCSRIMMRRVGIIGPSIFAEERVAKPHRGDEHRKVIARVAISRSKLRLAVSERCTKSGTTRPIRSDSSVGSDLVSGARKLLGR